MPYPGGPLVLVYHAVGDIAPADDPHRLVTPPAMLESHVRFLKRAGYRFALPGELPGGRPGRRTAVLTFDDGWDDARTIVAPLLEGLGVRAAFYVCSGWLERGQHPLVEGAAGRLLDPDGVRELQARGMEIGSHTVSHPDLRSLDDGELRSEVTDSRAALEDVLGRPVTTLAYPFGAHDERVQAAAARAGYDVAFTWAPGRWQTHAAPRLPAPVRRGAARLALKLLGVRVPNRLWALLRR